MGEDLSRDRHLPFTNNQFLKLMETPKKYLAPCTKFRAFVPGKFMIPISGDTTPEEADAKGSSFEEDGQLPNYNVWK